MCPHCYDLIEENAKIMELPCCDLKYHSACGIQYLGNQIWQYNACICNCGAALYNPQPVENVEAVEASLEAIRAQPGVTNELKAIKAKRADWRHAQAIYTKLQKEVHADFKEAVAPHIECINTIKKNILDTLRQSDEFKNVNRINRQLSLLEDKFKVKHDVSRRQMRRLLGMRSRYRWRSLAYTLKRRFRIKL